MAQVYQVLSHDFFAILQMPNSPRN